MAWPWFSWITSPLTRCIPSVSEKPAVLSVTGSPQSDAHSSILWPFAVLLSLFENLKRAHADPTVKAIVVAGANNNFSPGFDIQQFQNQVRLAGGELQEIV